VIYILLGLFSRFDRRLHHIFMGNEKGKKAKKLLEQKGEDTLDDLHDRLMPLEQGQEMLSRVRKLKSK